MGLVIAALAALLVANHAVAEDAVTERQWAHERMSDMTPVKGRYRNEQYGFSVPAVPGARAYRPAAPNPNHGVLYLLGY
jgi:hypothetical protein